VIKKESKTEKNNCASKNRRFLAAVVSRVELAARFLGWWRRILGSRPECGRTL